MATRSESCKKKLTVLFPIIKIYAIVLFSPLGPSISACEFRIGRIPISQITSFRKTKLFLGEFETAQNCCKCKRAKIAWVVNKKLCSISLKLSKHNRYFKKSKRIVSELTLKLQNKVKILQICNFFFIFGYFSLKKSFYPYIIKNHRSHVSQITIE